MAENIIEEEISVVTLAMLAKKLGLHRSTLVRMEARNLIPKAKWAGPPVNGRVYDAADVKRVKAILDAYFAGKDQTAGRDFAKSVAVQPEILT